MNKDAINPVFIITLAIIPLVSIASTLNEVVFLGLITSLTYIISSSIISTLEHLADRNLRFFVLMLISAGLISALGYVYTLFPNSLYISGADKINYCLVSVGILSLQVIYYDSKTEATNYFFKLLLQVPMFLLIYFLFGFVRELIAFGSIWKVNMGFNGVEFFRQTPGALLMLAFMCAFINAYWLSASRKRQQYNMLVEKYKMKINIERNEAREKVVGIDVDNAQNPAEESNNNSEGSVNE